MSNIKALAFDAIQERLARGTQDRLIFSAVPAGAEALLGKELVGSQITIAGAYVCYLDIGALKVKVEVHLTATSNSGTMPTTSGGTTFQDQATQKTALTGTGLMVTATRQTTSLAAAALDGSKALALTITLPAASSCTFTQAELNGI